MTSWDQITPGDSHLDRFCLDGKKGPQESAGRAQVLELGGQEGHFREMAL